MGFESYSLQIFIDFRGGGGEGGGGGGANLFF